MYLSAPNTRQFPIINQLEAKKKLLSVSLKDSQHYTNRSCTILLLAFYATISVIKSVIA